MRAENGPSAHFPRPFRNLTPGPPPLAAMNSTLGAKNSLAPSPAPILENPRNDEERREIDDRHASQFGDLISHPRPEKKGRQGNDAGEESGQERIVIHRHPTPPHVNSNTMNSMPTSLSAAPQVRDGRHFKSSESQLSYAPTILPNRPGDRADNRAYISDGKSYNGNAQTCAQCSADTAEGEGGRRHAAVVISFGHFLMPCLRSDFAPDRLCQG